VEEKKVEILSYVDKVIDEYRDALERLADEEDENGNPPENGKSSLSSSARVTFVSITSMPCSGSPS
jgi:hypothetical protein